MIEENVVSSAGARHPLAGASNLRAAISSAGFTPWLRDQQYNPR